MLETKASDAVLSEVVQFYEARHQKKDESEDDKSSSSSSSESEEESDDAKPAAKTPTKASSSEEDSSSEEEDSSDDDAKPAAKAKKSKKEKSDSDDSTDESEDEPVRVSKKRRRDEASPSGADIAAKRVNMGRSPGTPFKRINEEEEAQLIAGVKDKRLLDNTCEPLPHTFTAPRPWDPTRDPTPARPPPRSFLYVLRASNVFLCTQSRCNVRISLTCHGTSGLFSFFIQKKSFHVCV